MDRSIKLHDSRVSGRQNHSRSIKYEHCNKGANSNSTVVFALEGTLVVISLVTWFIDTLTDILVSFGYFDSGDSQWGALTLVLVFLPSIIIQVFSARWYHADGKMTGCYPWLIHIFLMQPLERYLFVLMGGWRAYKSQDPTDIEFYYHQQNDVCMLRLFEAFLESAPQLTLQVYIMVATNCASWLTGLSAVMSLIALGWSVTSYNHALRKAYSDNYVIFWPSLILQTLWHISMVASRVSSLVLFTCLYKAWVFLFLGMHWVIMTAWVIIQDTDFSQNLMEERFFNGVAGIVYCFCFFSLKEGATRWRMTFFYGLMFIESCVLMAIWFPLSESKMWFDYALFITVFAAFFFGLCCMLLYYRFCHPSGPIYCCQEPDDLLPEPIETGKTLNPLPPSRSSSYENIKPTLKARLSTASFFPRRSGLLKTQSKVMHVEFKEVATPSQLSPIKDRSPLRPSAPYDQTFVMNDTAGFHHYSVNASDCLDEPSYCNTLQGTGIDLSCLTPQLRNKNKSIVPRNLLTSDFADDDQKENVPLSPQDSKSLKRQSSSIITPAGYLGSPEDAIEKEVQSSPAKTNQKPIRYRDMFSTPLVQINRNVPLGLPLPDFTPIRPSVTPYLRASDRNDNNWQDDSFAQLQGYNNYLRNDFQEEATASLNVSQYDSFQTCEDDSVYYETYEELENPQIPTARHTKKNQKRELSDNSEPVTSTDTEPCTTDTERCTTDTDCVTTDSEQYTSATDTGYSTSNA